MELKPTDKDLEAIAKSGRDRKKKAKEERDQSQIYSEFSERAEQCSWLVDKIESLVPPGGRSRTSAWFKIRDDEPSRTQLQARVHLEHQDRDYSDVEMQINENTSILLQLRFKGKGKRSEDTTDPFDLVVLTGVYQGKTRISIFEVLGLTAGSWSIEMDKQSVRESSIPSQEFVRQVQEIEHEILDAMIATPELLG